MGGEYIDESLDAKDAEQAAIDDAVERAKKGYAEAWIPENEGDLIAGIVVEISSMVNKFDDKPYPIVTVRPKNGVDRAIHALGTVLHNEIVKQKPAVGDALAVVYLGEAEGDAGSYKRFRVTVGRPEGTTIDWSMFEERSK